MEQIEMVDIDVPLKYNEPFLKLNEDEQRLYKIIKEKGKISSHQLFTLYQEHSDRSKGERSFRNYMKSLTQKNLVRAIGDKKARNYEVMDP
jgi:hypothetical protein